MMGIMALGMEANVAGMALWEACNISFNAHGIPVIPILPISMQGHV